MTHHGDHHVDSKNVLLFVPYSKNSGPAPPALPPSTSSYSSDFFGAPPPPVQPQQQPAYAALPPSTSSYASPAETNGYGNYSSGGGAAASDPWGGSSYGAATLPSSNSYGAPTPSYTIQPPAFPPPDQDPFGKSSYGAAPPLPPEPLATPQGLPAGQYSFASPFPTSIAAPQHEYTPATQASSIGFASPVAQPYGAQNQQMMNGFDPSNPPPQESYGMNGDYYGLEGFVGGPPTGSSDAAQVGYPENLSAAPAHNAPESLAATAPPPPNYSDPALLSMNVLSGSDQPLISDATKKDLNKSAPKGSLVDEAYAKLVNMDAFDLVQDKGTQSRKNPFDVSSTTSNNTASLADMMKTKNNKPAERKEVMKTYAPAPGSLVLSSNQSGNFGGYGSQYGLGGMGMTQPPQQQQPAMGGMSLASPPPAAMPGYGGMQQQQQPPSYGQPPTMTQPYGQALGGYGMQSPPSMQMSYGMQQQYGQQPPPMPPPQQQQLYGQPPPMQQQQQYGF
jgi:hypothetical protein